MSNYCTAWSIQFPLNEHYYKLLAAMIDAVNETIGETSSPDDALKSLYPTLDMIVEWHTMLSCEYDSGDVVIYNNDLDGGSDEGAEIVRAFLRQHNLPTRVGFICSWTDGNEAGGVAYHVTKHGVTWKNLDMVLDELLTANMIDWQAPNPEG